MSHLAGIQSVQLRLEFWTMNTRASLVESIMLGSFRSISLLSPAHHPLNRHLKNETHLASFSDLVNVYSVKSLS